MSIIQFANKNGPFQMQTLQIDQSQFIQIKYLISSQIMFKHPRLNSNILVVAVLLMYCIQSDAILDFQYTEYTQSIDQDSQYQTDFNFKPVEIPRSKLQFPQACDLIDILKQPLAQKQKKVFESDIDFYLNDMKQKFLRLLTLTQKLSNTEEKIIHFESLINQTHPEMPSSSKIAELQRFEKSLKNLTSLILQSDSQLRQNLSAVEGSSKSQVGQSKKIQIDFNIDVLTYKIQYLKDLEHKSYQASLKSGPQIDYNQQFDDLQRQFKNESQLIQNLHQIIQKRDKLSVLKRQKTNLESSIAALELYIKQIETCNKEKQKIRDQFKNHDKINHLILELKEMKKRQEPNNTYCKGVVRKLTQRIITMVRYYDIVASCAADYEPKNKILVRQKQQLIEINHQITKLEELIDLPEFQRVYASKKQIIETMYNKIKDWRLKQFIQSPQKIAELKTKAEDQLADLKRQKNAIIQQGDSRSQRRTVSEQVITLIKQIKTYKGQYCSLYHQYDTLANSVWSQVYKYESQMNLKKKLFKIYKEERQYHEYMHNQLIALRAQIYENLN